MGSALMLKHHDLHPALRYFIDNVGDESDENRLQPAASTGLQWVRRPHVLF